MITTISELRYVFANYFCKQHLLHVKCCRCNEKNMSFYLINQKGVGWIKKWSGHTPLTMYTEVTPGCKELQVAVSARLHHTLKSTLLNAKRAKLTQGNFAMCHFIFYRLDFEVYVNRVLRGWFEIVISLVCITLWLIALYYNLDCINYIVLSSQQKFVIYAKRAWN